MNDYNIYFLTVVMNGIKSKIELENRIVNILKKTSNILVGYELVYEIDHPHMHAILETIAPIKYTYFLSVRKANESWQIRKLYTPLEYRIVKDYVARHQGNHCSARFY